MKKIIMSLLATLLSVFTATAQENTYSIVVKMQNGTVLTIGPNEADSIFFDEGKLNISGQSIDDIIEMIKAIHADTESLAARLAAMDHDNYSVMSLAKELQDRQNDIENEQNYIKKEVERNSSLINAAMEMLYGLKNNVEELNMRNKDLELLTKNIQEDMEGMQEDMEDMQKGMEAMEESMEVQQARTEAMEKYMNDMHNRMETMQIRMEDMQKEDEWMKEMIQKIIERITPPIYEEPNNNTRN